MKRFAWVMVVLTVFAQQAWVLGAHSEHARGPKDKTESTKGPQDKTEKEKGKTVPVPEPTTVTLLGAAAGVAVARKLWRNRQR